VNENYSNTSSIEHLTQLEQQINTTMTAKNDQINK